MAVRFVLPDLRVPLFDRATGLMDDRWYRALENLETYTKTLASLDAVTSLGASLTAEIELANSVLANLQQKVADVSNIEFDAGTGLAGGGTTADALLTGDPISYALADIADKTFLANFSGGTTAPTATALTTVIADGVFVEGVQDIVGAFAVAGSSKVSVVYSDAGNSLTIDLPCTPVNRDGDTMTGLLVLSADPTTALGAATKQYVDAHSGTGTVTNVSSANGALSVATGTTTPVLTVNSAPKLTTARSISMTGDLTWTVSFDGSANVTAAGTIAASVALAGSPTTTTQSAGDATTKIATTSFVTTAIANAVAGVNPAVAVQAATTLAANTSAYTYNNGASGIGATLTGVANTTLTVDGYTFTALGQRLLVKNDTQSPSGAYNGVYYVTQIQTVLLPVVLTRALDYDMPSDINNTGAIPVVNGTVNALTSWLLTSQVATVGTDPLTYVLFTSIATGTVTHTTGALTSGQLIFGNGTADVKVGDLSGDVSTVGSGVVTIGALKVATGMIQASAVTYAKIQHVSANSVLLGAGASGSGAAPVEITLGTNLAMAGTVLNATAAAGTWALINTTVLSSQTTANVLSVFSGTYAEYNIELVDFVPSGTNNLVFRFGNASGPTWETSNNYYWGLMLAINGGGIQNPGANTSSAIVLFNNWSTAVSPVRTGEASLFTRSPTSAFSKNLYGQMAWTSSSGPAAVAGSLMGLLLQATSYDSFQISCGSAFSGTIKVYAR